MQGSFPAAFEPRVENSVSLAANAPQNVQEPQIEGGGHCPSRACTSRCAGSLRAVVSIAPASAFTTMGLSAWSSPVAEKFMCRRTRTVQEFSG